MKTALLTSCLLLQGCMTITASKTLVVTPEPSETRIAVTASAVTNCKNFILFTHCTLNIAMDRAR